MAAVNQSGNKDEKNNTGGLFQTINVNKQDEKE